MEWSTERSDLFIGKDFIFVGNYQCTNSDSFIGSIWSSGWRDLKKDLIHPAFWSVNLPGTMSSDLSWALGVRILSSPPAQLLLLESSPCSISSPVVSMLTSLITALWQHSKTSWLLNNPFSFCWCSENACYKGFQWFSYLCQLSVLSLSTRYLFST